MIDLIHTALIRRLNALSPALPTAHENAAFAAVTGQPYQRIFLLVNKPVDHTLNLDVLEQRGIFQVSLYYPPNEGRIPAQQRAQAIADHFKPLQILTEGSVQVRLLSTAHIAGGMPSDDRWHVPVSIPWRSFKTS